MKMTRKIEQNGTGPLTVDMLQTLATAIHDTAPHEAHVVINSGQDARDHDEFWRVRVTWEEELSLE